MRLLTALAVAALLGSAFLASRHYARREAAFPAGLFVTADPATRVREGEAEKAVGIALGGYEDLLKEHPDDLEALRGRLRVAFEVGAVGFGQLQVPEFVYERMNEYVANRERLDPDGTFLPAMLRKWVSLRLAIDPKYHKAFYARAATAILTGARGDQAGLDVVFEFTRAGAFDVEFFPFARRYHPGWPIVEALATHYIEHGDLKARVEAGVTLLDYHALFGVGGDVVERYLPAIRAAIHEMLDRVHALRDDAAADCGRAAILGMAFLANRGDKDELRTLAAAKGERELAAYAPHVDTTRIARMCAGLDGFARMNPLTVRYKDLDTTDQDDYFLAAAHRATLLSKQGDSGKELAELLDLIEAAFDSGSIPQRILAMQVLQRLAPERGAALVARGLEGRGPFSAFAGALADQLPDPVAVFLPNVAAPLPEVAALAAASLLDLPYPRALQR